MSPQSPFDLELSLMGEERKVFVERSERGRGLVGLETLVVIVIDL